MRRRAWPTVANVLQLTRVEPERVPWTWRDADDPEREALLYPEDHVPADEEQTPIQEAHAQMHAALSGAR